MIVGCIRDHFPRIELDLPTAGGSETIEFILDTGFEGDLSLPSGLLKRVEARALFLSLRSMADGTVKECPVYHLEIEWNGEMRAVQVLQLENTPLLGALLLDGCHVDLDFSEGGEVLIEFPD